MLNNQKLEKDLHTILSEAAKVAFMTMYAAGDQPQINQSVNQGITESATAFSQAFATTAAKPMVLALYDYVSNATVTTPHGLGKLS